MEAANPKTIEGVALVDGEWVSWDTPEGEPYAIALVLHQRIADAIANVFTDFFVSGKDRFKHGDTCWSTTIKLNGGGSGGHGSGGGEAGVGIGGGGRQFYWKCWGSSWSDVLGQGGPCASKGEAWAAANEFKKNNLNVTQCAVGNAK